MHISDYEKKKSVSSVAERIERKEISSYSSEWYLEMDELFVPCLNNNSKNIIAKTIKYYLNLVIKASINHMSITSHLVRQPKNKLISNSEQLFNFRCNFYSDSTW